MPNRRDTAEAARLAEVREGGVPWRKWGPYLSERQWGTVREDYSEDGDAWSYFSHDQARSRAYHWGEDGLAGLSDDKQRLCFALALWNGQDPILKERAFGLTNAEGNHGEDVKEYYFYLDSTPTHSYMKWLYKYPQRAYPYDDLVATNRGRTRQEPECELLDTGVFAEDRYFDVFVEYAKAGPEDVLVRITAANRGPEAATLHLLPTLWFRNTWTWWPDPPKPSLGAVEAPRGTRVVAASHAELGQRWLVVEGESPLLFTENETNNQRLFGSANAGPWVKDGINDCVVGGREEAVNPAGRGTKVAAHHRVTVAGGATETLRLRLNDAAPGPSTDPFAGFDAVFEARRREADEFYRSITPASATEDEARVLRQALAGMLWTKQYYFFDADRWLGEHGVDPFATSPSPVRNREWGHMVNDDVISMPDKWEYPWYAAWDLAFHTIALSAVDVDFAKQQLDLMLREMYLHPSGQIPAYEWNFSDVNPPVHPWATLFLYRMEQARRGQGDVAFLKRSFGKLLANFTWWVNRKDRFGKNVFEGGFLGLDNIGVFDRSAPLPTGGHLEQADGTAWMALFSQNMLEIAIEIAAYDETYGDLAGKFVDHILGIGYAMNRVGADGMWDEEDGFYYDVLRLPDGSATRLKVRSMVGLLPLCATTVIEPWQRERVPSLTAAIAERARRRPELLKSLHPTGPGHLGHGGRGIVALVNPERLRRILGHMLDEDQFLSPYGIRALSRYHREHPYVFKVHGEEYRVSYLPGDSDSGMFGGNSNWRGPIWMPVNALLIRALLSFYAYHGDAFKVECPTGSGREMNLFEVAREIARRLTRIFLRDEGGRRAVFGGSEKFQEDPHWRDHVLFYEYFHGDNGAGIGASHQTGWTGLVASLIELFGNVDGARFLALGKSAAFDAPGAVSQLGHRWPVVAALRRFWADDKGLSIFSALLLVVAFVLPPLATPGSGRSPAAAFVYALLLISGVLALTESRLARLLLIPVAVISLAVDLGSWLRPVAAAWVEGTSLLSLLLMLLVVLGQTLRSGRVTAHRIQGAVAAYLLLGVIWAHAYSLMALLRPGAFSGPINPADGPRAWLYFSFVTLTTVGYGDVLPVHPAARSLAMLEAVVGPLYLAILIARLVALAVTPGRQGSPDG